ncbi:TolC family outer membrane protein [Halomonas sp. G11]|jgi:outer membrane protein|uniref:TolC family outer membrane protein n=1 Tax=Halomonas sp. G11 TaxID=1684425 RepID=UPI00080118FA|nr:TolC family outer membrane protein [Halomonas sp. G11]OAZ99121.1 channel protein TolC [Halomonas sp. G11]
MLDRIFHRQLHRVLPACTGAFFALASAPVLSAGLLDVYKMAKDNDPRYQEEFYGKNATDERYYQARAALLPQISLSATQTETSQDIVSSDNEEYASGSTSYPSTRYGASIEQSIYDYSRWAAFDKAKAEIKQAASELEVARQDLFLRVAERYFNALSLYETLTYLKSEKTAVKTNLEDIRARYNDGLVREVELLDAEARFQQVDAREIEVTNQLRDALEGLAEISGNRPRALQPVTNELQLERPDPDSVEAWEELARERSPRLKAALLATDVASEELNESRGGHFPTLDLSVNYESDETEGSLFGGGSEVESQDIALTLNVPVYSGGRTSSQVRESESLINASESRLERVNRELNREIRSGYQGILTAMSRERALEKSLQASKRVVESREVGVEAGTTPVIDLLDAERDLFYARSELASARYDYLMSILSLKHAAGVINADDLSQIDAIMGEEVDVLAVGQR